MYMKRIGRNGDKGEIFDGENVICFECWAIREDLENGDPDYPTPIFFLFFFFSISDANS